MWTKVVYSNIDPEMLIFLVLNICLSYYFALYIGLGDILKYPLSTERDAWKRFLVLGLYTYDESL